MLSGRVRNFVIAGAATLAVWTVVIAPLVFKGYPIGDNFAFNLPWIVHFLDQFREGDIYPRWLTDYSNGVGAPIFYFYAPGPFYLAAAVNAACLGCSLQATLTGMHFLLYALSSAAFYLWARGFSSVKISLLCSAFYALLPYHLLDLEVRASLGEAAAYVFMPLTLLGLRQSEARGTLPLLAAGSYAGIVSSHLPSAVLFAPALLIFALASTEARARASMLLRLALVGLVGVLLAAIYLAPALLLRVHLVPNGWVEAAGAGYAAKNWLLLSPLDLSGEMRHTRMIISATLATPTAMAAAFALVVRMLAEDKKSAFEAASLRDLRAAALTIAFCWLMMTDAVRWIYIHVGPFRQVQFPWRIGTVIDLMSAIIVTIAVTRIAELVRQMKDKTSRQAANAWICVVSVAIAGGMSVVGAKFGSYERTRDYQRSAEDQVDIWAAQPARELAPRLLYTEYPTEYRTKWIVASKSYEAALTEARTDSHALAYMRWRSVVLNRPAAWVEGGDGKDVSMTRTGPTAFDLTVDINAPAEVRVRRVYFPSWRLFDARSSAEIELRASEEDGLMAFDLPAGRHHLTLRTVPLREEIVGATISAATLLFMIGIVLVRAYRSGAIRVTCPILRPGEASRLP